MNTKLLPWDAATWASEFFTASKARRAGDEAAGSKLRSLRVAVFRDTVARVLSPESGLPLSPTLAADTRLYATELPAGRPAAPGGPATRGFIQIMVAEHGPIW